MDIISWYQVYLEYIEEIWRIEIKLYILVIILFNSDDSDVPGS